MYTKLKSCIRVSDGITEYFQCTVGTRQGCMLSPLIFSFYINELVDMLKTKQCQGVYVNEDAPNIMNLMYADDVTEGSDSVGRLQKMIDVLDEFFINMV